MPIMFTRGCEYGLQAMLYLAAQPPNTRLLQRDIASSLLVPPHFLGKILQVLAKSGLVVSQKGKTGGFALARLASEITLRQIIEAIDGPMFLDACVLGFPACSDSNPCPAHHKWKAIREDVFRGLINQNLDQLRQESPLVIGTLTGVRTSADDGLVK